MPRSRARGRSTGAATKSATGACAGEVDEPGPLGVAGLAERHGDRRAGVAHRLGHLLAAVQVAQGGVVDAVEDLGRHGGDATDGDVALGVARGSAGDEGVRHDDGAARAAPAASEARTRSMAARRTPAWVRSPVPSGPAVSDGSR